MHLLRLQRRGDLAGTDRPDGLVGDNDLFDVSRREAGQRAANLRGDDGVGAATLALLERFADADDRRETGDQRRLRLGVDDRVGLAEERAAFGVAEDHILAAQINEHRRGHFAGEGAARLVVHVLAAEGDARGAFAAGEMERRRHRFHVEGGGAEHEFDTACLAHAGRHRRGEFPGLRAIEVHLPVAGDDLLAGHAGCSQCEVREETTANDSEVDRFPVGQASACQRNRSDGQPTAAAQA